LKNIKCHKISVLSVSVLILVFSVSKLLSQTLILADPYYLLFNEKAQFSGKLPIQTNLFRPIFFKDNDSLTFSFGVRIESYFNDNAPNQENMDVRYFSKGMSNFNSVHFAINSPYFLFMAEPYIKNDYFSSPVNDIERPPFFSVLNDRKISSTYGKFRNLLAFAHYKGVGFGWHEGNRWWGPGVHSSLQMTNNTIPIPAQIIGTMKEIRFKNFGFYGLYTFAKLNDETGALAKYFTSINAEINWYGPLILSAGFSRNYLTGGELTASGYEWSEKDARNIIFEGLFTSDLIGLEYTIGGHDVWDQKISGYISVVLPKRDLKVYAEFGMNDNRMYFADFLSQPDHSMATIFGLRDYGIGKNKNWIWGFEWTNLMITYSSRHRGSGGAGPWYEEELYDYSSFEGRRWGAHSGADSDDWYIYAGYLSDKLMVVPALNYERHGIVSHRPAEVKIEFRLDTRYNYKNTWFGIYFEKQFEAFLGFPGYFYMDDQGNQIDASEGRLANSRRTNTIILSMSKTVNF